MLSADRVGQLDVFGHYGYTLRMYTAQVSVLQEATQIILSGLLQHYDCMHSEVQIGLPTSLHDLTNEAHEGSLANEELSTLLVLVDLAESHCLQPVLLGQF